jgi:ribosome-associated translation inhibitor RaiA
MQIQINTDHNIERDEALTDWVSGVVKNALRQTSERIMRVEVHLSDQNSDKKGGNDNMRCMTEARLPGRPPIVTTHQATTFEQALYGALDRLAKSIERTLERQHDQRRNKTGPLSSESRPADA